MTDFEKFYQLHHLPEPLIIGNVWDAQSAKLMEKNSLKAIATSSAAVAETLGYPDGEEMSFEEYFFVIKHIKAATTLPVSVDIEGGYGTTVEEIVSNLQHLSEAGVAGINIEDSMIVDGQRAIIPSNLFAGKLTAICQSLVGRSIEMFINVRCDAFLLALPDPRAEAIKRLKMYQSTGVHGLFLPCVIRLEDIQAIIQTIELPLNVMCMPGLPDFDQLKRVGVKRISMGNFLNKSIYSSLDKLTQKILKENTFASLF